MSVESADKAFVLQRIHEVGLIPVVRAESSEMARRAIAAICAGGISIVEITMTVPGAIEVIKSLTDEAGSAMLIGAGTVLDAQTAEKCVRGGAQFVVSPTLDVKTIAWCRDNGVAMMAGALTPTEIYTAWSSGADLVKVFPAGAVGGPGYLKAIKGPLPQIKLVPTGGVSLKTAAAFIEAGAEALGVGTDLVDTKALREGLDQLLTDRAREYVEVVKQARSGLK